MQSADLVILGGLNEGIWPRLPAADPWLGRGIRRAVGLPSPERRIGLSAHDFQQAMGARRVILTRATRDAEAPTVASRWLLRLENLLARPRRRTARRRSPPPGPAAPASPPTPPASTCPPPRCRRPAARRRARRPRRARPSSRSPRSRRWSATPTPSTRAHVLAPAPPRPAGPQPDALDPRHRRSTPRSTPSSPRPTTASRRRRRASSTPPSPTALAAAAPWPAVNAIWTARLDRAAPLVPRRRGRAPRPRPPRCPRGHGPPRASTGWRARSPSPPAPTASTGSPTAATPSTTTSPAPAPTPPRRAPSTCSCRSRPPSPRPAASRACRPAPPRHLELLEVRPRGETLRARRRPRRPRRDLGALRRADRPLPGPGATASPPGSARSG